MLLFAAVFGLVLLVVLLMAAIGAMLPVDYDQSASIELPGGPERVARALDDVARLQAWMPDVRAVRQESPDRWIELGPGGVTSVERTRENAEFSDILQHEGQPSWRRSFRLDRIDNTTRVTLRSERQVRNVFARFSNRFARKPAESECLTLEALARHLGEHATAQPRM